MAEFLLNDFSDECSSSNSKSSISDEEVMLASNNPKKRAGRKKFKETRHPIFRGVRRRSSGKWVCELREPNKKSRIWLGTYPTVEMAARAHDVAAIALRGRTACLNFADSAWRLPIPTSKDTTDIQKAAAEAAALFHPSMQIEQVSFSENANVEKEKVGVLSQEENVFWVDEEDIFSMPRLISSMAEGLMLPPPLQCIDEETQEHDHLELWRF